METEILRQLQELQILDVEKAVNAKLQQILNKGEKDCSIQSQLPVLTSLLSSHPSGLSENTYKVVIEQICIPLLKSIHLSFDSRKENVTDLGQINKLISSCLLVENNPALRPLIDLCESSLQTQVDQRSCTLDSTTLDGILDIQVCLEVILNIIHTINSKASHTSSLIYFSNNADELYQNLLNLLQHFQNLTLCNLALRCVSNLLKNPELKKNLNSIWNLFEILWMETKDADKLNVYICGLSNHFFAIDNSDVIDVRKNRIFWEVVQAGLSSPNSLCRKQSLYLIKRNVDICDKLQLEVNKSYEETPFFWWSKDNGEMLVKVWEDLIMLLETLEEKQIHVIKPMLPRLTTLIKASSNKGMPLLHTSWLTVIFKRGIAHESLTLMKWMTEQVLYLDLQSCPFIEQGQDHYLTGEFLNSIQDQKLYCRPKETSKGTIPSCAEGLIHLFHNCWKVLLSDDKRGEFFRRILETICASSWGPVPLMFICLALSRLPKSQILDEEALALIRKMLTTHVLTSGTFTRGAIQSFLVRVLINLTDFENTPPKLFGVVFSCFKCEDGLARGTVLWSDCVEWLKNMTTEKENGDWSPKALTQYMTSMLSSMLQINQDTSFNLNEEEVLQFSRFLVLTVDSGVLPYTVDQGVCDPSLTEIMVTLTDIINSIPNHPYMSHHKAEKAVLILHTILVECGTKCQDDRLYCVIKQNIENCLYSLMMFTSQLLMEKWDKVSCVWSVELIVEALGKFLLFSQDGFQHLMKLTEICLHILSDSNKKVEMVGQIKKLGAMGILSSVTSTLSPKVTVIVHQKVVSFLKTYTCMTTFDKPLENISQKEWGKIASLFISYQWKVVEYGLKHEEGEDNCVLERLTVCLDSLSVCGGYDTIPVYRCIGYLIKQCVSCNKLDCIDEALSVCWSHVQGESKNSPFWDILEEFVLLTFQPCLLKYPRESVITDVLLKFANELLVYGAEKTGIASILMKRLCSIWKNNIHSATGFYSVIGQASMYGNIFRKQDRQLHDVFAYIESLGNQCSVNELKPYTTKDIFVRAEVVSLLCSLSPASINHQQFAVSLLREITHQYTVIKQVASTPISITNSLDHRKKHRLLQIVSLLEPFIIKDNGDVLWSFVWDLLYYEHQPSLRHSCEWIILRMVVKNTELVDELWNILDKLTERKTTVICSIICIVVHLGIHLPASIQAKFYDTAFVKLLPWCIANHFNTRVHASAALLQLWKQCETLDLSKVMTSHHVAHSCLIFHKEPNNYTKNIERLNKNFFFSTFDPIADFSLETIFHTLPWLFLIPDDEWITPSQFDHVTSGGFIPLYNTRQNLKSASPGSWKFKKPGGIGDDSDTEDNVDGDFQKKIMPWRLMLPDEEVQEELEHSNRHTDREGLIVVTSLIDKIPNLGGLCRTSEIFGVSQYVIGKMGYMDDKVFKDLSVTAQKWLPITEVWHELLPQYLTEKRQEGYTLIGVEQTANSVSLTDFTFPKKSLLVLGNEKEGIPVELINQLDICVEIPQQGLIRSLNVHVSGALLIWEYRRQQLIGHILDS